MWRVCFIAEPGGASRNIVAVSFLSEPSEDKARRLAMRFYDVPRRRIVVRPPGGRMMLSGTALQAWMLRPITGTLN